MTNLDNVPWDDPTDEEQRLAYIINCNAHMRNAIMQIADLTRKLQEQVDRHVKYEVRLGELRLMGPITEIRKTFWQAPSGYIHWLAGCTGGPGRHCMKRVALTQREWAQEKRCRCALGLNWEKGD